MFLKIFGEYMSVAYICMLVLGVSCQQLGDKYKLETFCAPFVRRVGVYTFLKMEICIEHMQPTVWEIHVSWKYRLILYISCQPLGDECKLERCRPGTSCTRYMGPIWQSEFFPICHTLIFSGPNLSGPNLPGPDLPSTKFPGPNLPPRGPICRGPICRGPICRGPIC